MTSPPSTLPSSNRASDGYSLIKDPRSEIRFNEKRNLRESHPVERRVIESRVESRLVTLKIAPESHL